MKVVKIAFTIFLLIALKAKSKHSLQECPCAHHPETEKPKKASNTKSKKKARSLEFANPKSRNLSSGNKDRDGLAHSMSGLMLLSNSLLKSNNKMSWKHKAARGLSSKGNPFDSISLMDVVLGKVDIKEIMMKEKSNILKFIRQKKLKISKNLQFENVLKYVKMYMKEKYDMNPKKIEELAPNLREYFPSIMEEAMKDPDVKNLTGSRKLKLKHKKEKKPKQDFYL